MGGLETRAKYEAFTKAFSEYLIGNFRSSSISAHENDILEYLDKILDEEFSTVLDGG